MTAAAILLARAARGSRAPHGDGASIVLAIEGGAMRGVISAGMVSALEELGLTDAFDAVYGSSAGAINGAYFLAGQARLGTAIYYEDINTRQFIDFTRPLRGGSIVDLGFLMEEVALRRKPLDTARVINAASPLSIIATDVETRAPVVLRGFASADQLLNALRASSTMPVVAGEPWTYDGQRYLDASLSEPIPVPTAERDGHTHIVALLTRSGAMRASLSAFDRYYVGPRLARVSPDLAEGYRGRAAPYGELLKAIDAGHGPLGRASVIAIRAAGVHVSKLERRAAVLKDAADAGARAVTEWIHTVKP